MYNVHVHDVDHVHVQCMHIYMYMYIFQVHYTVILLGGYAHKLLPSYMYAVYCTHTCVHVHVGIEKAHLHVHV